MTKQVKSSPFFGLNLARPAGDTSKERSRKVTSGSQVIRKHLNSSAAIAALWIVSACAQAAECAGNGNSGLPCPPALSHADSALAIIWLSVGALLLLGPPLLVVSLIKFAWRTGVQGLRLGGRVAVAVVILRWLGIMNGGIGRTRRLARLGSQQPPDGPSVSGFSTWQVTRALLIFLTAWAASVGLWCLIGLLLPRG